MYTIVVKEDHSLTTTRKERIMQRSKLVDTLWFLVEPKYNDLDIASCTVLLEYVLPVSKKYCSDFLTLSNEMYKDYLKYVLPFNTELTSEAGKIELQLTFIYSDLDASGKSIQQVRKTSSTFIEIVPITAWSDVIPDASLAALDQRIIKTQAQIKELEYLADTLNDNKADNIEYNYDTNELQLLSGDKRIGNIVALRNADEELKDGIPVVDFSNVSDDDEDDEIDNVVDFSDIESEEQYDFNNVVKF